MLYKHLLIGALAATCLSISGASATVVTWDFSDAAHSSITSPATGGLFPDTTLTQFSVPDGVPVVATGFASNLMGGPFSPTALFRKAGPSPHEFGLGLQFFGSEIIPGTMIQLDLSNIVAPFRKFDLSFSASSVTGGEKWGLWLSNTSGSFSGPPALTGTDEKTHFINASGFTFLDVSAITGDVLVHTLDATIPEPSTWAMMLLGFAGLGFLGYRRRAKVGRLAQVF